MRFLHGLHLFAMFILFMIGLWLMRVYRNSLSIIEVVGLEDSGYQNASLYYGLISACFFVFTIVLGWKTRRKLPMVGSLLLIGGAAFFFWSLLMASSPRKISIAEVFIAWCAWLLTAVVLNGWAFLYIDSAEELHPDYDDDILDDL